MHNNFLKREINRKKICINSSSNKLNINKKDKINFLNQENEKNLQNFFDDFNFLIKMQTETVLHVKC